MTIKTCAGCDYPTDQYEDYGNFILCPQCDEEALESQEETQENEVLAQMMCGHRNVWEFVSVVG